jgi:hypothetical protein
VRWNEPEDNHEIVSDHQTAINVKQNVDTTGDAGVDLAVLSFAHEKNPEDGEIIPGQLRIELRHHDQHANQNQHADNGEVSEG